MKCPKCKAPLSEKQVRSLNGQMNSGKRKAKRGGRPKLSPEDKRVIRASRETGAVLAARYDVSVGYALRLRKGI